MSASREALPGGRAGADPLSPRDDISIVAPLAFGDRDARERPHAEAQHLALLPRESLELDLSDPAQREFGDYELLELIGEGGMGVVYRAWQRSLDREVAIKLLAAGPWASQAFVERFRSEARNAARMQHPNIVAIYEVDENEDLHFFSMRLVRGPSLALEIKRHGKFDVLRAAQLLRTVAEAVDYAHRLGVLHLDLKPANVLLDESGAPHVADFGLARRQGNGIASDPGEISGTPSYMAPEQASAGALTPATDIWGLGTILYQLVTGHPPFAAATPRATLALVAAGALCPPRNWTPDLPLDVQAIILKCMAPDAGARYRSAREVADDLTRFLEGRQVLARPLGATRRAWRWAGREPKLAATAAVAILALVLGMAATTRQWRHTEEQKQRAEDNAAVSSERLWSSRLDAALRRERDGNGFEALPQLVSNIDEEERAGRSAALERREFGMVLHQGVTLIGRLLIADANPMTAALSPDGSLLAVALNDVSVRWYDTTTLQERGRADLSDMPTSDNTPRVPQLLTFIDDHRLRATLEWYSYLPSPADDDTVLIDLDHARVVHPPDGAFAGLSHITYADDGTHALLFDERARMQLWHVDPWAPRSPVLAQQIDYTLPYLVARNGAAILRQRGGVHDIDRIEPRNPATPASVRLPPHESLTAWAQSADGSWLALGDADGHVFVVALGTLRARQLPIPTGREVSWLAFDDDGGALAVARADGAAFAFDVASGTPLHSGPLQHEFALRNVALSRDARLLVASGDGEAALWRLPYPGPAAMPATKLASGPTRALHAGPFWTGASLRTGLLATADFRGEIRLWRMPAAPLRDERAPRGFDERADFDGEHLLDVAYDRVRIASLRDPGRTSEWITLPDAISFAELADRARTLVVVAGHAVHVFDAASMRERHPPVPLPGDPLHLALDSSGSRLVLAFVDNAASGFGERVETFELKAGSRQAAEVWVKGPLRRFSLSADGARLLIVGPPDGATEVFDAASLRRLGAYAHDPEQPVLWADFAPDSTLWLVARSMDDTQAENAELIRWNMRDGQVQSSRNVAGVWPVGIVTLGAKPLLAGRDRLVFDPGSADERSSARLFQRDATTVFAVSHDGRFFAHARGRDVQIYDAATLTPVGTPLHTDMAMIDGIVQLAFSPQDDTLLGRTQSQHWFVWNVAPDPRPLDALRDDVALLAADESESSLPRAPAPGEAGRLRQSDPGQWSAVPVRPVPAAARLIAGAPLRPRAAGLSPLLLDLTPFYTSAPDSLYNVQDSVMPTIRDLPFGVARIENVDYDVRGGVELRWGDGGRAGTRVPVRLTNDIRGVAVPAMPIAAFHLLLYATFAVPVDVEQLYARVRLHYRDGSEAILPLRTNRELPGRNERKGQAPIGWVAGDDLRLSGEFHSRLISNPTLPNPHPERLIDSLDVEASENFSAAVLFAITAEPAVRGEQAANPPAPIRAGNPERRSK